MVIRVFLQIDGIKGESVGSAHQGYGAGGNTAGGLDLSANKIA